MRVAVTDATGLVGKRVATALTADRRDVLSLCYADQKAKGASPWPKTAKKQADLLAGTDSLFLVGLNANRQPSEAAKHEEAVIRAAVKAGVKQIIALSSTDLYRPAVTARGTLSEQSERCPVAQLGALGAAAHHLETVLRSVSSDVKITVIRVPIVLSPESERAMAMIAHLLDMAETEGLPNRLQGIDVDDLATVLVSVLRAPRAAGHALNLAGPSTANMEDVLTETQRLYAMLTEFNPTSVNLRPDYGYAAPVIDDSQARNVLPKRAMTEFWVDLAKLVQRYVHTARAAGALPPLQFSMSETKRAIQEGSTPLKGKNALVTGATDGIGRATALMLSRLGAQVIGVGRNEQAGEELERLTGDDPTYVPVRFIAADLANIAQLRTLAKTVAQAFSTLDYLINNAGAAYAERTLTADGLETNFAINALAPTVLPQLLMSRLQAGGGGRVVSLNSNAHRMGRPAYDDLQSENDYAPLQVYARTKLYQAMLTRCMAEKLKGTGVSVHSIHPGSVRTEIEAKNGLGASQGPDLGPQAQQRMNTQREARRRQMISPEAAAAHVVHLATSSEYDDLNGLYFDQDERVTNFEGTQISEEAWTLWETCGKLVDLTAELPAAPS